MDHAIELYSACCFEFDGTQQIRPHSHDEIYQIYYVKRGKNQYLYNGKRMTLTEGEFLLMRPGDVHGMVSNDSATILDIKFDIVDSALRIKVDKKLGGLQISTPEVDQLFSSILSVGCMENDIYYQRISSLLLEAILYLLLQKITPNPYRKDDPIACVDMNSLSPSVRRALPHVEGAVVFPVDPFSPDSIARQSGYNARYISGKFSEELGVSITKYFRILRLNKAKDLLYNTDMRVSSISNLLNYEDVSHFIKHFKNFTGMSPREFRNHYRDDTTKE